MRGGKPECPTLECNNACNQDCCCTDIAFPLVQLQPFNDGCCDCSTFKKLYVMWNFTDTVVIYDLAALNSGSACPSPATVNNTSKPASNCLAARLAAHGGYKGIDIRKSLTCSDGDTLICEGIPDRSASTMSGYVTFDRSELCMGDAAGLTPPCNQAVVGIHPLCISIVATDDTVVLTCNVCPTGTDAPLSSCSSSSSSSDTSSSSGSSGSSSSASSGSSSSGGGDSSSSSSSGSGDSSSSSSGSCVCSLYLRDDGFEGGLPIIFIEMTWEPDGCAYGTRDCITTYDPEQPPGGWAPGTVVTATITCCRSVYISTEDVCCTDFITFTVPASSSSSS